MSRISFASVKNLCDAGMHIEIDKSLKVYHMNLSSKNKKIVKSR